MTKQKELIAEVQQYHEEQIELKDELSKSQLKLTQLILESKKQNWQRQKDRFTTMKNLDAKVDSVESLRDENENLKILISKFKNDCKQFDFREAELLAEIEQLKYEIKQKEAQMNQINRQSQESNNGLKAARSIEKLNTNSTSQKYFVNNQVSHFSRQQVQNRSQNKIQEPPITQRKNLGLIDSPQTVRSLFFMIIHKGILDP